MIRLLLVDDQALIRVGFRMVLEAEPDLSVVGEAADGAAAIALAAELEPDVVLMDVRMPNLDGIAATAEIVRHHPGSRVLVLTTFDLDEYAFAAIRAGAGGFLLKDAQRQELVAAVRAVHRGDAVLAPRVTRALLDRLNSQKPLNSQNSADESAAHSPAPTGDPTAVLTEREHDVFVAIAQGLTNSEIAERLFLSESTVKTHVGRVLAKLDARDRIHVVILAHRLGLVDPDAPLAPQ
ncbi:MULTISPECIES: response regulator transcription factor [unclassified Microbacterium]|uniref:response regulator n=1 Tax=unclassified Microbacterium TaxID=2609290 RepID=UPI001D9D7E34|nr:MULTISPECIES: response regulator transcription factor [unclassified Microbacterium]CAH0147129.1 Transcriptional regulatory protein LiaR [Microbacterium sp. Bi121]HWK76959.1 response regulator transcription factor [Microbacterium sp.]